MGKQDRDGTRQAYAYQEEERSEESRPRIHPLQRMRSARDLLAEQSPGEKRGDPSQRRVHVIPSHRPETAGPRHFQETLLSPHLLHARDFPPRPVSQRARRYPPPPQAPIPTNAERM